MKKKNVDPLIHLSSTFIAQKPLSKPHEFRIPQAITPIVINHTHWYKSKQQPTKKKKEKGQAKNTYIFITLISLLP